MSKMLLIEFDPIITDDQHILVKYRDINEADWFYVYCDLSTLNILLNFFGIVSVMRFSGRVNCDNGTLSNEINLKYCGAAIHVSCNRYYNYFKFNLAILEQDY